MTDAPTPIPAEGVWTGDTADLPNWEAMPRRNRRRRRRSPYPIWVKYVAWLLGLAVIVTVAQIAYHSARSDPRDARAYAERELRLTMLRPNERVLAMVNVFQRPAIDYFRPTRGLLVLTDAPGDARKPVGGRLLYLGLQPRDPLSPADAPPTFDEREWPVDTALTVSPSRTFFLLSRGLAIAPPREQKLVLGISANAGDDAARLMTGLNKKYAALRAVGWQRREARRAAARSRTAEIYQGRRVWYHTIRRGEALASVAKMFQVSPEQLRSWNGITGDRIRIGDQLVVKPWTKQPVAVPAGAAPEFDKKVVIAPPAPVVR